MKDAGNRRVLVVVAHPDDEVLGMGGTIALHTAVGETVRVLCLTEGSSAQYSDADRRHQKADEAQRAARVLGVDRFLHLDLADMRLDTVPQLELNRIMEEHMREFAPEVVYTVHPDVNTDHQAVFRAVAVATRSTPGQAVRRLLAFAPLSSFEWTPAAISSFVPNWFVDIGETLARKLEAFGLYQTELRPYPHPRSERAVRAHAEFFGTAAGCEYAEPFVLIRNVVRSHPTRGS